MKEAERRATFKTGTRVREKTGGHVGVIKGPPAEPSKDGRRFWLVRWDSTGLEDGYGSPSGMMTETPEDDLQLVRKPPSKRK